MYYDPRRDPHGLKHNPMTALVVPRPIRKPRRKNRCWSRLSTASCPGLLTEFASNEGGSRNHRLDLRERYVSRQILQSAVGGYDDPLR